MKLKCKIDPFQDGKKVMNFTKGKTYDFTESYDLEGWETIDDNGEKETFFEPYILFEKTYEKVCNGEALLLIGDPTDEIEPKECFGIRPRTKIKAIGDPKKDSYNSRYQKFKSHITYSGIYKSDENIFMVFLLPKGEGKGTPYFGKDFYLLIDFCEENQELYINDYKNLTVKIFKAIFHTI